MSRDQEKYGYTSITRDGRIVEGQEKPEDWAIHYYEVRDDGQWTDMTYRFEARINPEIPFRDAKQALTRLRESGTKFDRDIIIFLEDMARREKRTTVESLFAVKDTGKIVRKRQHSRTG